VWFRYLDREDAETWARYLVRVLPDAIRELIYTE
jgi:hypothetical protein